VTESVYGVREETPPTAAEEGRTRIFFPHLIAQRTTQWERGADPMTQVAFTSDYDSYGQPCTQTAIAVPRGRDHRVAGPTGAPYLATHTVTDYAQRDDADRYLVGRAARVTTYEIVNDGSLSLLDLYGAVVAGSVPRRVFGQTLNFYDGKAFEGLGLGQLGDHGVLARSKALVLSEEILREAYSSGPEVTDPPELPPYLAPSGITVWTEEYLQEFRDLLPPVPVRLPCRQRRVCGRGGAGLLRGHRTAALRLPGRPERRREGLLPATRPARPRDDRRIRRLRPAPGRSDRSARDHASGKRLPGAAARGHRAQRQPQRRRLHTARSRGRQCHHGKAGEPWATRRRRPEHN
jgi:hypothetical protein